ncbi:concanavalin A-like lectin/glucanase domain-containing protein [Dactylonectria estremocensis]|uniref:Concanavalin A-like lectin/glucanase domain-containing protein n=1 Tax=Dactylonectria estremocensis TaxID=1079267 RepID=A0A9P9ICH6_9HYPO|nr:concanavalin A-like lectin/glucanase domain-containing protein [Dactylonectria estremocensis]
MLFSFFLLSSWALSEAVVDAVFDAVYILEAHYDSSKFFREFGFFDGPDPTHGYVEYVDVSTARELDLAGHRDGLVYMGVDHTTVDPANGRKSVRVSLGPKVSSWPTSSYPGSLCGVWPAMWLHGPDWPVSGEIDIIEGVNSQSSNIVTLHTSPGCAMDNIGTTASMLRERVQPEWRWSLRLGGGVYALEWTSSLISVWFFSRRDVPVDITNQEPNPPTWDQPAARFNGNTGCSIDAHFCNNNLVFDTTFSVAGGKARVEFVATNPFEFIEAYWLIASIRIYQQDDANQGAAGNYSSPGTYLSP